MNFNANAIDGDVIKLDFGTIEVELDDSGCSYENYATLCYYVTYEHPEYYCSYEWGNSDTLEEAFALYNKFVSDMKDKIESGEMDEWKR